MIGFDYTGRIDPAALRSAGCTIVFRYLSNPGWPKNLTGAEARELLAAGIPIVLNYETTATFMLGGYSAGVACATSARAQAAALGAPAGARIFYSADFDASASQVSILLDFLRGAASADGAAQVGLYGGLRAVQAAAGAGYATWQTVAWSGGQWDTRAVARQTSEQRSVGGVQVDVNQIINSAGLGAWAGPTTGDDMQLSDQVTMPPAAVAAFPDFGFNSQTVDVGSLLAWTAARVSHIANHLPGPVDVNALAAALAPHVTAGATADQIALAVVGHLNLTVSAK